jgi:hypothetical protein
VIPECLAGDESEILIEGLSWNEAGDLVLRVRLINEESRWAVCCIQPKTWRIHERFTEGLALIEDDPVLWPWQYAVHSTYFIGRPVDAYRAACRVLSAMPDGDHSLGIRPETLADLLQTGNGCLGQLPVPAFRIVESTLSAFDVRVYQPGDDLSAVDRKYYALMFGDDSYVVAQEFSFDQI